MELRQLTTFKAVADHKSFTRAARAVHMAQSSVSAQVKALEEELSVRLFDRIGRKVLITDAGNDLYDYVRRILEMTKEVEARISGASRGDDVGTLTIRVPESLATVYMPGIVSTYHKTHPLVRLEFIHCSDLRLREELNSGRIDLAFLLTDTVMFKDVNVRMLGTETLTMICAKDHGLMGYKKVRYEDLSGQTLLLPRTD